MTTSADQPTRPTLPSDAPTLPGDLSPASDVTRPTARPGMSDTRATIPAVLSGSAPTQIAGQAGMSATAATALNVDGLMTRSPRAASGSQATSYEGQQWGDFAIGRLLGRGGMGAVYAGKQASLDRPVAIKVLIGHLADNEDFRKRFLLEARAAARINSPHVVQVYYAGTHADVDFFAMEYVEGTDLARKLKDGWRPEPAECLQLLIQACRSLVALGEHRIVHRDIKPANYMLTTGGVVKLMDFGLVKFASEAHGLTQTGTVMGTVNYFSPEQGRGEVCDQRTDLYALGVMFYEMLTSKLPFTGGDATSVIYQHIHAEPKPPRVHNPAVTEPYQSVVLKCLEKDPQNRYQTAVELLADLESIQRGEPPKLASRIKRSDTGTVISAPSSRRLTLAAAVVIAAVILGLALLLRPTPTVTVAADPTVVAAAKPPVETPATIAPVVSTPPQQTANPNTSTPVVAPVVALAPAIASPKPPEPVPTKPVDPPISAPGAPPVVVVAAVEPSKPSIVPPANQVPPPAPAPAVVEAPSRPAPTAAELPPATPAKPQAPPESEVPAVPIVAVVPPAPVLPEPVVAKPVPAPAPVKPPEPVPTKPTPAKPAAPTPPPGLSTPVQATLHVTLPAGDPLLKAGTWLWWLEGANGRSGRLSARSTKRPEIEWTAPALPGTVTLHIAAIGSERQLTILLTATAATAVGGSLAPFLRATFIDERRVQRLRRDVDGSWWMVDVDGAVLTRNADGWLTSGRFVSTPPSPRPVAVATTTDRIAILDSEQPSLLLFNREGGFFRAVTGFSRPSDVVALADGTWAVADLRGGGVQVVDQQGAKLRTYKRTGAGGFSNLTRLGVDGRLLYALDAGDNLIAVFDGDTALPVAQWNLDRAQKAVALAARSGQVCVLFANGELQLLDARGQVVQKLPSAVAALPDEALGVPADVALDGTGDVYVTYPERETIVRHSADGKQFALRQARAWTWRAYASDGANHLYTLDPDHHRVVMLDSEGWRLRTFGKGVRQGGTIESPLAIAAQADGAAVTVLDEETMQVTRFDSASGISLAFGGKGKNEGQFDSAVALAMDQDGRSYVLDVGMHRVSMFDAQGHLLRSFGRYERGDAPDMLRAPRQIAVTGDGATAFIYDDDTALIKVFAIDHATNQVRHLGNLGGRGTNPGQFGRVTGLACDRRGRLYCLDYKRADLQVFSFADGRPSLLTLVRGETYGIRKMLNLALSPDGIPFIIGGDQLTALRWQP